MFYFIKSNSKTEQRATDGHKHATQY